MFVLVPLALAAAVSPVMVTEQTVLLAAPDGRRAGMFYATGTVFVLLLLVGAVVLVGQSLSLPTAPHVDASLDVLIGGLLAVLALTLRLWRRNDPARKEQARRRVGPPAAFAFGAFSMTTSSALLRKEPASAMPSRTMSPTTGSPSALLLELSVSGAVVGWRCHGYRQAVDRDRGPDMRSGRRHDDR